MIKKFTLLTLAIFGLSLLTVQAQVKNVSYDFQKNTFDNDYRLPSEERFTITGFVDSSIQLVEVEVYQGYNKKGEAKEYYSTYWLKDKNDQGNQFYLSIKKPLRQNDKYDFNLKLYRSLNSDEKSYTQQAIVTSIQNFLTSMTRSDSKQLSLDDSPEKIQKNLTSVVIDGLVKYRTRTMEKFGGFSSIVISQLEDLSNVSGKRAKNIRKDEDNSLEEVYENKISSILTQVELEIEQYLNQEVLVLDEIKTITDHPTEKQKNIIAINAGYGGAWFDGNMKDFNYGHAPYVGVSFPLGKKAFSSKFWSNTSISAGVFILNFKDKDKVKIKGPIIQRPVYVALGYKFFRFLRFNAGAVVLEKKTDNDKFINKDKVFVRPFVGLSLELNFWADFAK